MNQEKTIMVANNRRTGEEIIVNPKDEKDVFWTLDKREWEIIVKRGDKADLRIH